MARLNERLADNGIRLELTEAARELLVNEGYDPQFGARPLRRAVQRLLEDPLAEKVLEHGLSEGDVVLADAQEGAIVPAAAAEPEPAPLLSDGN